VRVGYGREEKYGRKGGKGQKGGRGRDRGKAWKQATVKKSPEMMGTSGKSQGVKKNNSWVTTDPPKTFGGKMKGESRKPWGGLMVTGPSKSAIGMERKKKRFFLESPLVGNFKKRGGKYMEHAGASQGSSTVEGDGGWQKLLS